VKEFDHIDELIRQKFEGFEPVPPESVWEKVNAGITPDAPAPKGGRFTPPIITGLIVLVGLISLLFLVTRVESTLPGAQAGSRELAYTANRLANNATSSDQQLDEAENTSLNTAVSQIPVRKPFDGMPADASSYTDTYPAEYGTSEVNSHKAAARAEGQRFSENAHRMDAKSGHQLAENNMAPSELNSRQVRIRQTADDYAAPVNPMWSVGAYFNPEVSFNSADESNSLDYSFQALPRLTLGNWYVQSGLGIRIGGDHGNAIVSYNKYLGSYDDVYEVTFDSTENGLVPTYHTQKVDVYDTIPYYSISQTNIRYTYLDIPLLVGHEWNFNRFSLSVHAGPALSLLAGRSAPVTDYPDERIRILSESPQIPARETMNWQLTAGAGFNYRVSDNISFSLEPTFRYFLSGQYEESEFNSRQPYSIGIRAGLIYKINH
jgi:hypothetical protein